MIKRSCPFCCQDNVTVCCDDAPDFYYVFCWTCGACGPDMDSLSGAVDAWNDGRFLGDMHNGSALHGDAN